MKKFLLGFLFTISASGISFAQDYDMDFNYQIHNTQRDTLVIGETYPVDAWFTNFGPAEFNDSLGFRVFVGPSGAAFTPTLTKESFELINNQFLFIPNQGSGTLNGNLNVTGDHFIPNAYNIVIIWPTDCYSDRNNQNNFKTIRFFVKENPNGNTNGGNLSRKKAQNTNTNLNFCNDKLSIYPNPANDVLNVMVDNAEKATLKVTDLSGRTIQQLEITSLGKSLIPVQLTQNGKALPNGIYLISLESGNYREIKKFVILNK